jgi:2-alkyl-3-oxoalkanoate reductase
MRILITGGTGFLGNVLVRRILERPNVLIRLLVRDPAKANGLDPERVEVVVGDLRDALSLEAASRGVDLVFHLAGTKTGTWAQFQEETVLGTERLVCACLRAGAGRFVYVSSIYVVESLAANGVIDETTPYRTNHVNSYARSRILAEKAVLQAVEEEGLDAVVVRPGQLFGPGMENMLEVGCRTGPRTLVVTRRDGPVPTAFVENAASALLVSAERGQTGEIYQLVDDDLVSKSRYLRLLQQHVSGLRVYRVPGGVVSAASLITGLAGRAHPALGQLHRRLSMARDRLRANEVFGYDNRKLKALGWKPNVSTEVALLLTMEGYAAHPGLARSDSSPATAGPAPDSTRPDRAHAAR